jgi:hypothetical protein
LFITKSTSCRFTCLTSQRFTVYPTHIQCPSRKCQYSGRSYYRSF